MLSISQTAIADPDSSGNWALAVREIPKSACVGRSLSLYFLPQLNMHTHILPETDTAMDNPRSFIILIFKLSVKHPEELSMASIMREVSTRGTNTYMQWSLSQLH